MHCVKPFTANLPGLQASLEELLNLNLTSKTRTEVNGAIEYVSSFTCVIMTAVWVKILTPIDLYNNVLQARDATLDVKWPTCRISSAIFDMFVCSGRRFGKKQNMLDIEIQLNVDRVRN